MYVAEVLVEAMMMCVQDALCSLEGPVFDLVLYHYHLEILNF